MSTVTSTPPPRGPRRKQRLPKSIADTSSPNNISANPYAQGIQSHQNLSRVFYDFNQGLPHDARGSPTMNASAIPTTPPRTPYNGISGDSTTVSDSSTAAGGETTSRRKTPRQKNRPKNGASSSTPISNVDSTTPPLSGHPNATPGRPTGTPSRTAYAGPTFHASPAPSALPMPSFFSKSVPEANTKTSLQARLEEESSDYSEPSPTKAVPRHLADPQVRDGSPLDLFFNADREEKAKARNASASTIPLTDSSPPITSPDSGRLESSSSPSSRHHSRHPTDSSINGIFALELDGAQTPNKSIGPAFSTPYAQRMSAVRTKTAPSSLMTQTGHEEEDRKAKTQALKNLLMAPQPHHPSLPSRDDNQMSRSEATSEGSLPFTNNGAYSRSVSGPPALLPATNRSNNPTQGHRHGTFPVPPPGMGSPRPINGPSNLRREVSPTKTPDRNEMPNFPSSATLSRSGKLDAATISRNNLNAHIERSLGPHLYSSNGFPEGFPSVSNLSTSQNQATKRNNTDVKAMEDDLRRILKLDVLGAPGVSASNNGANLPRPSSDNRPSSNGIRDRAYY